ncbi:hypothetical protein E2C01_075429 [Portunus trituberculatus]|uniref:Uncharacterized protein n=1 Tax=Portunus trituberculatus TaxID=210409 RepID=A0A5B7IFT1_PORTR|nr:hypothetical protein [Portunus trituberculatus]
MQVTALHALRKPPTGAPCFAATLKAASLLPTLPSHPCFPPQATRSLCCYPTPLHRPLASRVAPQGLGTKSFALCLQLRPPILVLCLRLYVSVLQLSFAVALVSGGVM